MTNKELVRGYAAIKYMALDELNQEYGGEAKGAKGIEYTINIMKTKTIISRIVKAFEDGDYTTDEAVKLISKIGDDED